MRIRYQISLRRIWPNDAQSLQLPTLQDVKLKLNVLQDYSWSHHFTILMGVTLLFVLIIGDIMVAPL